MSSKRWLKCSVKSVSSVRENPPQRVVCVLSHSEGAFYFSQKNTEEQNAQTFTETLSQPISQNVTANLSWKASVFSVCRRPSVCSKCAPKTSVNSVRSVREKPPQRVVCVLSHSEGVFSFSQKNTEEQKTQGFRKMMAPPPSPPPKGRGVITEISLWAECMLLVVPYSCQH